ncbi:MAG TPA: IS3 family transposase, partial [Fimbriimonadaceae bacterium]|nr:IS3 family transposase [Fimbriimonadaceae bacterium]
MSIKLSLAALGMPKASYYRYAKEPELKKRRTQKDRIPLTPPERTRVIQAARDHPLTGYKQLTHLLVNEQIVGVRAHQTYALLKDEGLLGPKVCLGVPSLKRPAEPTLPNQVWHMDLMYLRLERRWFYLIDILDAYSRYVVHWRLNPTMEAQTVTMAVQEALERWGLEKAPAIVHDSGCQFLSKEWRDFASHRGIPSIRTRIAHPESNGRIERLHRTHRREALQETDDWSLERARQEISRWIHTYNDLRPHHALKGLPPVVYYLGEPDAAYA